MKSQGIEGDAPFLYIEEISFGCESNLWWLKRVTHRKVGLSFPSPGNLPNPGIQPASLVSLALADRFYTASATWEAQLLCGPSINCM